MLPGRAAICSAFVEAILFPVHPHSSAALLREELSARAPYRRAPLEAIEESAPPAQSPAGEAMDLEDAPLDEWLWPPKLQRQLAKLAIGRPLEPAHRHRVFVCREAADLEVADVPDAAFPVLWGRMPPALVLRPLVVP
jgi:hypothetical protein